MTEVKHPGLCARENVTASCLLCNYVDQIAALLAENSRLVLEKSGYRYREARLRGRVEKAETSLRALENVVCLTDDPRRLITENGGEIPPISREKIGDLVDRVKTAEAENKDLRSGNPLSRASPDEIDTAIDRAFASALSRVNFLTEPCVVCGATDYFEVGETERICRRCLVHTVRDLTCALEETTWALVAARKRSRGRRG